MPTRSSVALLARARDSQRGVELGRHFDLQEVTTPEALLSVAENDWVKVAIIEEGIAESEQLYPIQRAFPQMQWLLLDPQIDLEAPSVFARLPEDLRHSSLVSITAAATRLFDALRDIDRLGVELELRPRNINQALMARRQAAQARFRWDHGLVCDPSGPMGDVLETLRKTAPFDVSVLIQGESGTGKELCARALHQSSLRQDRPWIAVNCAAIPDELLESELFGHRKGSFTHAVNDHPGLFQQAEGGTLFLDEIADMSMRMQSKLLRVLQEKSLRPVGAVQDVPVDVRVVTACNKDLRRCVDEGGFRQDLYFRLATVKIDIPPLRERRGDIPLIADYLLRRNAERLGMPRHDLPEALRRVVASLDWPGNVRELENELVRALIQSGAEPLEQRHFTLLTDVPCDTGESGAEPMTLRERVEQVEDHAIEEALARHNGNKSAAAAELGLSRVGLRNKLERRDRAGAAS